ncbi:hypothetical protein [Curtobacterium sp. MCPF17_021]|uniref:hypothetical protein n=1 Tax=Curtobacterium sp. MCPF17_021 TaxID=2175639 RepID=UPI0011B42D13|nr:hypothetical protein [Curtobacterium sp. MCPF17_021]WIE84434.1 hypothetical protein DEJ29_006175 [Curtobacterium sp. MCPF17_021]
MKTRTTSPPQGGHAARGDLVIIRALVMVGIVAVIISAGYVFNGNLYAYGLCSTPPHTGCSDAPWFSSISLSFFGGIAAVGVGAFLGLRRHGNGRHGMLFPLAALGAVAALTGLSIAILKIATPL